MSLRAHYLSLLATFSPTLPLPPSLPTTFSPAAIHATLSDCVQHPAPSTNPTKTTQSPHNPDAKSSDPTTVTARRNDLANLLLREIVKPAFVKDKHKEITAAGRKAIETYRPPVHYDGDEIRAAKVWKYEESWTVDVLGWCLGAIESDAIEANWPLLVPPILSLLDDIDTPWRLRGCAALQQLLEITPTQLLRRTGIGKVYEQAILPYLACFPPLTEEAESLQLLDAAYPTLLALVRKLYPDSEKPGELTERVQTLDRIMRQHVLGGLHSVGDNAALSRLLFEQLGAFVAELQVESVKHLKLIIPMLRERLSSPFVTASTRYMLAAATALKIVQLNAWPRVPHYRMQIISGLSVAWCRLADEVTLDQKDVDSVKMEIRENVKILKAALAAVHKADDECKQVLASDARLVELSDLWADAT